MLRILGGILSRGLSDAPDQPIPPELQLHKVLLPLVNSVSPKTTADSIVLGAEVEELRKYVDIIFPSEK